MVSSRLSLFFAVVGSAIPSFAGLALHGNIVPIPENLNSTLDVPDLKEPIRLTRRATEGIHLVNCGSNGYAYSIEIYCSDDSNCNYQPSSSNECFLTTRSYVTWEQSLACGFTSGATFSSSIASNVQSYANYTKVGTGHNQYHTYNIYKDNQHVMYTTSQGVQCKSIYYCLDA